MTDLWHELLVTEENEKLAAFQRKADRIAFLIVASDYERIDVEIEKAELRQECARLFPDKLELYDMIYESRFQRLWEQFRD
ncbi:MAG TPA: hypothetical protein VGC99_01550 [Candidatus Tectomicrobia bacterium]|jgi:hypothetical protein